MELIGGYQNKEIWLHSYEEGEKLKFDFQKEPFVSIIWNNRENFLSISLIEQLLKAHCKYLMMGGKNCERWHDLADEIYVELSLSSSFNSESVMTTWHDKESLKEVFSFAVSHSDFDHYNFKKCLIISIDAPFLEADLLKTVKHQKE